MVRPIQRSSKTGPELVVASLVARLQTLANDDVAGRTGTDAATGVVEGHVGAVSQVEDAAG